MVPYSVEVEDLSANASDLLLAFASLSRESTVEGDADAESGDVGCEQACGLAELTAYECTAAMSELQEHNYLRGTSDGGRYRVTDQGYEAARALV